jgi:hypothetical protein
VQEVPVLDPNEIEVLQLVSIRPYEHGALAFPQRLRMGRLMANGLVRLRRPDTWEITPAGIAALAAIRVIN